jgi:hypothetical protein
MILALGFAALCSAIRICAEFYDPATGATRPLWQRVIFVVLELLEWF